MRCWMCSETFAGWRYAHAASTRTRRARPLPALVMPPCRRDDGQGDDPLDTARRLQRFDERRAVPGRGQVVQLRFDTREAVHLFVDGAQARAGFVDKPQLGGFPLQAANQLVDVGLACADGPDEYRRIGAAPGRMGDRGRILARVQPDVERRRFRHG